MLKRENSNKKYLRKPENATVVTGKKRDESRPRGG
jgi:hypothetical protein